jgi:hypothetical protein
MGIDLTPLLDKLGAESADDGRLFLSFSCAEKGETTALLHACAIRYYDDQGSLVRDSVVEVQDGTFGKKALTLETILPPWR